DAHAAVRLAETWQERSVSANEITVAAESDAKDLAIPDNGRALRSTISVGEDIALQNVEVLLDLQHQQLGDLEIILVGPDGTESILINRPGVSLEAGSSDRGYGNFDQTWLTTSTNHWAGQSAGDWTLIVKDTQSGKTGTLQNWELRLYGDQAANNSTYVYTNEFAVIGTSDRTIITDTEGLDIINTSAVSGDVVIDLSGTHQSSIAGKSITFSSGTVIENAFSGDGNDKLYGNASANTLSGGRGNDELYAHFEETTEEVAGNRVYLQGDKQVRQLTGDVDIISIEDAQEFYVSSTSVGITSSGGKLVAIGSNHYAGFDVNNDLVDLSSLTSVSSFEDLIITNKITLNNITWAGIAAPDGGMILLAGVDAADLTSNNFIFAKGSAGDTLYGGEGDDNLFSSSGSDHLDGGAGNDLAIYADGKDNYAISILNNKVLITDTRDGTSDTLVDVEVLQFNGIKYQVTDLINFKPEVVTVNLGSLAEDNSRLITQTELLSQTVDINGDTLAISSVAVDPAFGTMTDQGNRSWLFTPSANFHGENVEISFVVSDGEFEVPAKALLDITSVNDAPEVILVPPTQTALEGSTWQYVLPANSFNDADGDDLVITVALADGSPLPDWLEFDTQTQAFNGIPPKDGVSSLDIKVTASDGSISTSLPLVLQIEAANSAPSLFQPILDQNTDEDEVWTFTLPADTFADADGDTLAYSVTLSDGGALPSWLTFDANMRTLSGTPPQEFNGRISLLVTADDGLDTTSTAFDLIVASTNNAPVLVREQAFKTLQNRERIIDTSTITKGFREVDGDELVLMSLDSTQHGTAVLTADGNIVFTPEADYVGPASITYTISDGRGGSVSAISLITVAEQIDFDPDILDGYKGTAGDDNIRGGFDDDAIFGDKGDDVLDGVFGKDTYYYRKGDGNDVIDDNFGDSTLVFTDLMSDEVVVSRSRSNGRDIIIEISETNEAITLISPHKLTVKFADRETWSPEDLSYRAWIRGTEEDDDIRGTTTDDTLDGGAGDDKMDGYRGADTYRYQKGDGNDIIDDNFGESTLDFTDLYSDQIVVSRNIENFAVTIDIIPTGEQVTVSGFTKFGVSFADGEIWTTKDVSENTWIFGTDGDDYLSSRSLIGVNMNGGAGDDRLSGSEGQDVFIGGRDDDTLTGRGGSDSFVFETTSFGNDTIYDFVAGVGAEDVIRFDLDVFADFSSVIAATSDASEGAIIRLDESNSITLIDVSTADLHADDFQFV
ncbi:cadherin-like domain-containing protein, partial [Pseudovibrio sp. POLY-S9]|uniref:tandem-95 repeat protein n=1 Tax=Pseudovibrio sp. POLY-S9 TaxID=1576596 RepID=UPI000AD8308A